MEKIPNNAKLVFKGVVFDTYHWDQEMFDGSFATFEAIKKRDSATVIAVVGDSVIINDEEQPGKESFQALPGGVAEEGDSPLACAKRELLEETGYTSEDWQELFVTDPFHSSRIEWNNYFFIARNCKKIAEQKLDNGEKITTRLVPFEEFLEWRKDPKARNRDLFPVLERASKDETEKQKLKELLFANN